MGATGAGNEKGPLGPFLFFGANCAPKGITRYFLASLSCSARKPGLGILPRPLSGKNVRWTFFYSASPLRLALRATPAASCKDFANNRWRSQPGWIQQMKFEICYLFPKLPTNSMPT